MGYLLKMLSDMLQNRQPLSHIHICPKPKSQTRPHRNLLSIVTEFSWHSHCHKTLVTSVSPIGISVSPRWDCNLSVYVHYQNPSYRVWVISPTEITMQTLWLTYYQNWSYRACVIGPTEFAWPTLWLAYYQSRSHRVCIIGLTEITLCPNPNEIGPTELTCRSHRKA